MSIHLGQVLLTAVVTAVVSLLVMESYQTTPWLAAKVMRWSVRLRYADNPERATVREEELIGLLEDLPTLFKLPTAGGFLLRALSYRLTHRRGHARLAVKRDALLLVTLYLVNCYTFSSWPHLMHVTTEPQLALVWLYGLATVVPLAWRDRAPVLVFSIQGALTVAAWPIMTIYIPVIGIPTAMYAVSAHCSRKVSLLTLLTSTIPIGLVATTGFKFYSEPAQQLGWIIPTTLIFVIITVGAWGAGRLTRASQRHVHHQATPRADQPLSGARFRIAATKAGLVFVCTGTIFGLELKFTSIGQNLGVIFILSLAAGVLATIESVARPPRFYHGFIGGVMVTFFLFLLAAWPPPLEGARSVFAIPLSSGVAFGAATALTCTLVRKFKHAGVTIGAWVNLVSIALATAPDFLLPDWLTSDARLVGFGFAAGTLAGFATAIEHYARENCSGYPFLNRGGPAHRGIRGA